jgi:hypothetical protein
MVAPSDIDIREHLSPGVISESSQADSAACLQARISATSVGRSAALP